MKVIGGSFGLGEAKFNDHGVLQVRAAKSINVSGADVKSTTVMQEGKKSFSASRFIVSIILFPSIFGGIASLMGAGVIGFLIGVVLSFVWSFYSHNTYIAEVTLKTGDTLILSGTRNEINALILPGGDLKDLKDEAEKPEASILP